MASAGESWWALCKRMKGKGKRSSGEKRLNRSAEAVSEGFRKWKAEAVSERR